jgi:hypothetical protein
MKPLLLLFAISLTALMASAQQYDAAKWKTWLLDNPEQITTAAVPNAAQTKTELQSIKQNSNKPDEKKLAVIKYWDAGAPSYRWNQIVLQLLSQKYDVLLRSPAAWMNIAIYDATILAWKE